MHRAALAITILLTIVLAGLGLAYLFRPYGWLCAYDLPGGGRIELYYSRNWEISCPVHARLYDQGKVLINMKQVSASAIWPVPVAYFICLFDDQTESAIVLQRGRLDHLSWAKLRGNVSIVHRVGTDLTFPGTLDSNAAFDLIEPIPRERWREIPPR